VTRPFASFGAASLADTAAVASPFATTGTSEGFGGFVSYGPSAYIFFRARRQLDEATVDGWSSRLLMDVRVLAKLLISLGI
jgi:hypothetical protein